MSNQKKEPKQKPVSNLILPGTIEEGFTQSEISEMGCMERWYRRYNQRLYKPGIIPFALRVGAAWHDAMEQFYATQGARVTIATLQPEEGDVPSQADIEDFRYWNHVLPAMLEAYCIYYKADPIKWEIFEIERELDIVYRGIRLRGKIDLTIDDGSANWIVDHKTTSRLDKDVVAGWDFRFQFMFYIWMLSKVEKERKIKGFYINAVKKPELRVKKLESLPEFAQRVREDMIIEPDKYFYREPYIVTKGALQHFEEAVVDPKISKLEFIINNPDDPLAFALTHEKNTDECQKWGGQPCAFIELCRHGDKMEFLYRTKEQKHSELENVA